jgi:hypothetical protein
MLSLVKTDSNQTGKAKQSKSETIENYREKENTMEDFPDVFPDGTKRNSPLDYWDPQRKKVECMSMLEEMSIHEKKWKMTASREAMFINNSLSYSDLSEGKRRLYEKVLPVFQFLSTTTKYDFLINEYEAETIEPPTFELIERIVPPEEAAESAAAAYNILLYYIDKIYPGVSVRLDTNNEATLVLINEEECTYENLRLLKYLLDSWSVLATHEFQQAYEILNHLIGNYD